MKLLASVHNKFTCVNRTGGIEWPSPMARWGLKTGRTTTCKPSPTGTECTVWYREAKTSFLGRCFARRLFDSVFRLIVGHAAR